MKSNIRGATMTSWVRLWHDMPTDPKWRTIARKSNQRIGDVIAVFNFLMVNASANAMQRGTLSGFEIEDVASALELQESDVEAIISSMQGKVLDGYTLTGWDRRQPKREDNSTERSRALREKRKLLRGTAGGNKTQRNATQCNAPDTETDADADADTNPFQGKTELASIGYTREGRW